MEQVCLVREFFGRRFPCLKLTSFYSPFFRFAEVDLGNDWIFVICFISEWLSFFSNGQLLHIVNIVPLPYYYC